MGWSGLPKQFEDRIIPEPNSGCWLWLGALGHRGHPEINKCYGTRSGHRFVYKTLVGPVPDDLFVDHQCNNPSCMNPQHLGPLTSRGNTLRSETAVAAKYARRTHCKNGHAFTAENTISEKRSRARICRQCRIENNASPQHKTWVKNNRAKLVAYSTNWRSKNRKAVRK